MLVAPFRRISLAASCTALGLLLTACGGQGSEPAAEAKEAGAATLENCGRTVTVEQPPRRAVSLNQDSTEILLSLGLADRMAGTATWTDPVLPHLAKDNAKVKRLADNNPSFEKVLDEEPDFVTASFESTLGKGGVATREAFEDLGVGTYVSPADCAKTNSGDGDGARTDPLSLADIHGEVTDLAKVFGVEERGEKLVADLGRRARKATDGLSTRKASEDERPTLLYWFANAEAPYMGGCCGAPGIITEAVGGKNVFDDTKDEWPQINWETVADRDPDVLVIGDLTRKSQTAESAARKIAFLESHPATRTMTAVKRKRYVQVSGAALNPSIRTVDGIEEVAAKLREFGLAK
ncbi:MULTISPECIES: ABC transporter substrate-binding protein [Streptomyces]|uniref:ABC transporter substrate-binding protein n=2 Tax=Streptomyces TaxID=1883 RepID=A0A8H9HCL8_9ACTN|nr:MULTISPECIES: ABC transporter substrate-binding protein [Streptomyces]MDQ0296292.1 iron complex transport system substrate-binding protein [Streptomyces sp. DSM 41037]WSU35058.1 ABC transporter substrate-binding protein [Streptomyces gougerotii]GFH79016.1 ABC transporter substrate-binding protein [Streptomyces gougerotii]GGU56472.1 ABC transporter substrate-binding protein [Streptomyces gougerotii]